jgi:hypothetical protein
MHSNIYDYSDVYAPDDIDMEKSETSPAQLFGASRTTGGTIQGNARVNNMADLLDDPVVSTAVKGSVRLYIDDCNPAQIQLDSPDFWPTAVITTKSYNLASVLQELNKVYSAVSSEPPYTFFLHQDGLWCPKGTYQRIITSVDDDDDDWKDFWVVSGHRRVLHILIVCICFIQLKLKAYMCFPEFLHALSKIIFSFLQRIYSRIFPTISSSLT